MPEEIRPCICVHDTLHCSKYITYLQQMAKCKPLSLAKPLPSCPYFMVNITFGAVCCCMFNHSLDRGINPTLLPFKVLEISIEKPPHKKGHKTSTTDYRPILLLPVTEQLQIKIWRQAFYVLNHDKSQMEVLSKSNVKLLLWLPSMLHSLYN
jgi:hypothetical protein